MSTFNRARTFIYRNARPLDLARFQYHFENGSKDAVLTALAAYQNEDGGFGHALEPDLWNQQSTPFSTSCAISILKEINLSDCSHPILQGVFRFLSSGVGFCSKGWLQKMPSNNDFPHAPWWTYEQDRAGGFHTDFEYNPTAELAGFCLRTLSSDRALWKTARRITAEALKKIRSSNEIERHELGCCCSLYMDLKAADLHTEFQVSDLEEMLKFSVKSAIETNPEKWSGYVAKPSDFFNSRDSIFYADNKDIADYECDFIVRTQLDDGSWSIPWGWNDYPEEWAISKNWWKAGGALLNLLYLKGMGKL